MPRTTKKANEILKNKAVSPITGVPGGDLRNLINNPTVKKQVAMALLGTGLNPDRYTRVISSGISRNPKLAQCTQTSFLGAMMQAAQLGLEPNTSLGYAYLIPYRNKGVMECQFQIGYQGMIELARRSGLIVQARTVYENDNFDYSYGLNETLEHKPARTNRGKPIFYYAIYKDKDGYGTFVVLSREDVEAHAKRFSKSFNNGPWQTDFDAMALKTAIKQVLKLAPLSVEFKEGINSDESFKNIEIDKIEDTNALELEPEFIEVEEEPEVKDEIEKLQSSLKQETVFD